MRTIDPRRRQALAALAALGAVALLPACATPFALARPLNPSSAPRPGDNWRYAYTSGWRNEPPRQLQVTCLEVGTGVRDRITLLDSTVGEERTFVGGWELVERPVTSGFALVELSPYLAAFGGVAVGERSAVRMPPANFGTSWSGVASAVATETVQTPAGSFAATRVDLTGNRLYLRGQMDDAIDPVYLVASAWYAPNAKRVVRFVHQTFAARNQPLARDTYELVSMKLG